MRFDNWKKRKQEIQIPPDGMTQADIATQSSICTGETLIGFLDPHTGRLLQAVVVREAEDVVAFYRKYGYEPPVGIDKKTPIKL